MKILAVVCLALSINVSLAQETESSQFRQLLNQVGLEYFEPLDAGYKAYVPPANEFQNCQFAIRSGKEDMEIRYFVLPWNENNPASTNPHVTTFRALTSVATNADEAVISALQADAETLEEFNADWGMTYFFQPKPGFSDLPFCRMISLYKEGRGTIFIFYHFKNPDNEALDKRRLAVRFD